MSDGIFEFMDSQHIMAEVHASAQAGQPPSEAAKKLVRMARKWVKNLDGHHLVSFSSAQCVMPGSNGQYDAVTTCSCMSVDLPGHASCQAEPATSRI